MVAQQIESSNYTLKLNYGSNKRAGSYTTIQNESGFLTGVIYGNDSLSLGVSSSFHSSYLNSFSDNYWKQVKGDNSQFPESNEDWKVKKVIIYSFYPKRTLSDSLLVYCKYITYTLKSVNSMNNSNYDIEYSEEFIKVLQSEYFTTSFIQSNFSMSPISLRIVEGDQPSEKTNLIDKSPFPFEDVRLKDYAKKSQVFQNDLIFGIDLIRTDRSGNKIILKRTDFPLKSFSLNTGSESLPEVKTLFYGFIEVPFQIYNPDKLNLFNISKKSKKSSFYSVYLIPLSKEKNSYNLEFIISRGDNNGNYSYSKKLNLAIGEKINIELQPDNWRYEEVVEGERMQLNSEEDYNKFVKDYLILTLDEGSKEKSQTNNRNESNKAKYVETRSKEEVDRDYVKSELQYLSKQAVDYCYATNNSIKNWQIPNEFRKSSYGIYRVFKIADGIEIEGEGKLVGNDKTTPIRSVIKVTSQRKSTTHYVKSGESVRTIAAKYRVTSNQIVSRNRLKSQKISVGQKLVIDDPSGRNNLVISQVEVKN